MRLGVLEHGHKAKQRLALRVMRLAGRTDPDPVAKTSLYRPELFGRPWLRFAHSVMRGPSDWSAAERELLAAFVSRLNACPFCIGIHEATTTQLMRSTVAVEQLDHWPESNLDARMKATMELLEKVTLAPDRVGPADVEAVRAAGVSDGAIVDALYVCFLFNTVNRLANAFGYSWQSDADRVKLAAGLNRIRYRVPEFLLR
jgi:uncharacterized peroxidase-related enzyme